MGHERSATGLDQGARRAPRANVFRRERGCGFLPVSLLGALVLAGCSDGTPVSGDEIDGEMLYLMPHEDGNTFACGTCHALAEPAPDGFLRPGHPIGDAAHRPSYKNGELSVFREAVNVCRTEWMGAPAFQADDPRWLALRGFLEAQSPAVAAPTLTIQRVDPPSDPSGGDPMRGQELFNGRCIVCHGRDARGTLRAPQLAGRGLELDYIVRRVRTSGRADSLVYDGLTGGRMPFWAADRLSDEQLIDIAAWVNGSVDEPIGGMGPDAGMLRECPNTHPRVGQVATLTTRFHDVSGTATIVDDCTVRFDMFDFDGGGIDVRAYGGPTVDRLEREGFAFGPNLLRREPYENETLVVQLEEGQSLDNLGAISVWCVPVGQSFGDGTFGN